MVAHPEVPVKWVKSQKNPEVPSTTLLQVFPKVFSCIPYPTSQLSDWWWFSHISNTASKGPLQLISYSFMPQICSWLTTAPASGSEKNLSPSLTENPRMELILLANSIMKAQMLSLVSFTLGASSFRDGPQSSSPKPPSCKMGKERKAHHPLKGPRINWDHSFLLMVHGHKSGSIPAKWPVQQEAKRRGGSTSFRKCSQTFMIDSPLTESGLLRAVGLSLYLLASSQILDKKYSEGLSLWK